MFSGNRGGTATYKALARGRGCSWNAAYRRAQEMSRQRQTPLSSTTERRPIPPAGAPWSAGQVRAASSGAGPKAPD